MMHRNRRWGVGPVSSPGDLAHKLTEQTWTLCTGFYVEGHEDYLFLNDATHEDGAGEYAVCLGRIGSSEFIQLESITFSWCRYEEAVAYLQQAITGQMDKSDFAHPLKLRVETLDVHQRCHLCA
jgi:hypothetical protein